MRTFDKLRGYFKNEHINTILAYPGGEEAALTIISILKEEEKRGTGRTTRIIDKCIQHFFKDGYVTCNDHHDDYNNHREVTNRVKQRLILEHQFKEEDLIVKINTIIDNRKKY